jgi:type IV pilus assembly protein PilA
MLTRIKKAQQDGDEGFTLIELLVVVIIIGILAAIAIPTFLSQREKAWKRAAQSDLRNAATVMEEGYSDDGTYANVVKEDFHVSDDVTFLIKTQTATAYCVQATHGKLAGADEDTFHVDNVTGKVTDGACA